MITQGIAMSTAIVAMVGCSVDKSHEKYDQLRYEQLQKSSCEDMASFLSTPLFLETPEDYETALKRCNDMKSLTFEEYKRLSDYGRETGAWDIYAVYPEKK